MTTQLIIDIEALSPSYLPDRLLHREDELSTVSANMKGSVNMFIHGSCGSGKTSITRKTLSSIGEKATAAYLDCNIFQTTYSVLKEIIPKSELIFYRSNYELTKELIRCSKAKKFVVCFDSFEKLRDKNLISELMSLNQCVVLISESEDAFLSLPDDVRSNTSEKIELKQYTIEQSIDILRYRAEKAMAKWALPDSVLKDICSKIKGNISLGLNALKSAALKAEREGKRAIEEGDVNIPDDCPQTLSQDEKAIVDILQKKGSLPAGKLYESYIQSVRHPKGERSFREYMTKLNKMHFIRAVGEKRGRIYEIEGLSSRSFSAG